MERKPGLAGAARAGQGEQANVLAVEQRDDLLELALSAEEGRRRDRQVRAVERPESGKVLLAELVDPLRSREVLKAVLAEVAQPSASTSDAVEDETSTCPPWPTQQFARPDGRLIADIALVGDERRSRMQADTHVDRPRGERRR